MDNGKSNKTLVLMYHNVRPAGQGMYLYDVRLETFKRQMELVHLAGTNPAPHAIEITFDDGYSIWADEVLEVLNSLQLKATFFIALKYIDTGRITRDEIRKLHKSGMTIGSHSVTHSFMHTLRNEEIDYELSWSKQVLEDIIGEEVKYFSIPRGGCDKRILEYAKRAGYAGIYTSEIGMNMGEEYFRKRVPINKETLIDNYADILAGRRLGSMAFFQGFKDFAKKLMGIKAYNYLRSKINPLAEEEE